MSNPFEYSTWRVERPTVREINAHLFGGSQYCYIDLPDGRRLRIARDWTAGDIRRLIDAILDGPLTNG